MCRRSWKRITGTSIARTRRSNASVSECGCSGCPSSATLPAGTRLEIGTAVVEISAEPHTGCKKFAEWFGRDAARFVNLPEGRVLRLRGLNAPVVVSATVRPGDPVRHAIA